MGIFGQHFICPNHDLLEKIKSEKYRCRQKSNWRTSLLHRLDPRKDRVTPCKTPQSLILFNKSKIKTRKSVKFTDTQTLKISPRKQQPLHHQQQESKMNSPFRGLRRTSSGSSGNSYPYPRCHSTVMVIPSNRPLQSRNGDWSSASSLAEDSPTSSLSTINFDSNTGPSYGFERRRPPLNRAIPPIPESKSNESIMSQLSKSIAGTPLEPKLLPMLEQVHEVVEDKSVIIENKMADSLVTPSSLDSQIPTPATLLPAPAPAAAATAKKNQVQASTATGTQTNSISSKLKQPKIHGNSKLNHSKTEPPKSPLMSMAHSVRCRLTKLGNKFHRSESHSRSPIRSSTSLIAMSKNHVPASQKMAKSNSMDTAPKIELSVKTTDLNAAQKTTVPQMRSQITLIPSPTRSPRPLVPDSPVEEKAKPVEAAAENGVIEEAPANLQTTTVSTTAPTITDTNETIYPKTITSPTSSNTDTIYSGRTSSTTRRLTSPDWSENFDVSKTAVPALTPMQASPIVEEELEAPQNNHICTSKIEIKQESKAADTVALNNPNNPVESIQAPARAADNKAPSKNEKKDKKEDKPKTPKLSSKIGLSFGSSKPSKNVLPSPKIKPKTRGNKKNQEDPSSESAKLPRKSIPTERKSEPPKRRSTVDTEMKLIKKIERSLIPLMPHSGRSKLDNNKNLDLRSVHVKSVNSKNRRAPLAECESTRVENSPAVELPPIGFDRLTSSPGARRRAAQSVALSRASTTFAHDANGNLVSFDGNKTSTTTTSNCEYSNTKTARKSFEQEYEDEIPTPYDNMANDTFLNHVQKNSKKQDEEEKMSMDSNEENKNKMMESVTSTKEIVLESKGSNKNHNRGNQAVNSSNHQEQDTLMGASTLNLEEPIVKFEELSHENDVLRQQLSERDRLIESLRAQLASIPSKN